MRATIAGLTVLAVVAGITSAPHVSNAPNAPNPAITGTAADVTIIAAGDIAGCDWRGDERTARLVEQIPGTVLTLGDLVYENGTVSEFQRCYEPSWGRLKARTRPSPGNHEYHTPNAQGYFNYFGDAAGPGRRGYYSFDLGEWHIISLNSNIAMHGGSEQERWLRADLQATGARCVLAFWHHPRFTSGRRSASREVTPLWEALEQHRADVVLQAHHHAYERFGRRRANGNRDDAQGIRSFVVGTGGAALSPFGKETARGSEVRYNKSQGVLKVRLLPDEYAWEFVTTSDGVRDRGKDRCVS